MLYSSARSLERGIHSSSAAETKPGTYVQSIRADHRRFFAVPSPERNRLSVPASHRSVDRIARLSAFISRTLHLFLTWTLVSTFLSDNCFIPTGIRWPSLLQSILIIARTSTAEYLAYTNCPHPAIGSFCERWSAGPPSPACSAAVVGGFVVDGADDVEKHVVDKEEGPWSNYDDAQEELLGRVRGNLRGRRACLRRSVWSRSREWSGAQGGLRTTTWRALQRGE